MRRWECALFLAFIAACGDDDTAAIVIELASTAAQTDDCDPTNPEVEPAEITAEQLHFLLCTAGEAPCSERPTTILPVQPITPVDAGVETDGIFVTRNLAFDAQLGRVGPLRIEVIACNGPSATARGAIDRVTLGERPLRIRLYSYDQVSCAGPRERGEQIGYPDPRAFHAMTRLSNGDILIYGGVTSAGPVPATKPSGADWTGMTLAQTVEVYRPSAERFLPVTVQGAPFLRAFFSSMVLSDVEGRATIRVVGGLTSDRADTPVIRFDQMQGFNALGSPIVPHENAQVGPIVDLVYDPASLTLAVQDVAAAVPRSAMNALALAGSDPVVVPGLAARPDNTIEISDTAPGWNPTRGPAYRPAEELDYCFIPPGGAVSCQVGTTGRFGHTATPLGSSDVLVWGGNVFLADVATVEATAGEIIGRTRRLNVAGGGVSLLPAPTAFHTASLISERDILLAGGLLVGCEPPACATGITTARPPPEGALRILRSDAFDATSLSLVPVTGAAESTVFHAVTAMGAESARSVVLTGGAAAGFAPVDQIQRVGDSDGDGNYDVAPLILDRTLIVPRWGHAAARLPDQRILVTGGVTRPGGATDQLQPVATAEVIAWGESSFWNPCPALVGEAVRFPDGGTDAGVPLDAGFDGGSAADSGVAAMDSGL